MDGHLVFIVMTMLLFTSRLDDIQGEHISTIGDYQHALSYTSSPSPSLSKVQTYLTVLPCVCETPTIISDISTADNFTTNEIELISTVIQSPNERQSISVAKTITSISSLWSTVAATTTAIITSKAMNETTTEIRMILTTTRVTIAITTATSTTSKIESTARTTVTIEEITNSTYSQKSISSASTSSVNILHVSSSSPLLVATTQSLTFPFYSQKSSTRVISSTTTPSIETPHVPSPIPPFFFPTKNSALDFTSLATATNQTFLVFRSLKSFFYTTTQQSSTTGNYQRSSAYTSSLSSPLSEGEMHKSVLPGVNASFLTISTKQINKDTKISSSSQLVYRNYTSVVSRPLSSFFDSSALYTPTATSTRIASPAMSIVQMSSTVQTSSSSTVTISLTFDVNAGDSKVLPCESSLHDSDTLKWKRGGEFLSFESSRVYKLSNGSLLVRNVSTIDSGYYLCVAPDAAILYNVTINVEVEIEIEMTLRILNVEYTEDLKNKTSKSYKTFEKNFTEAMDIIYNNTEGYQGVIILDIRKGSAKVDFKVVIIRVIKKPGRKEPEIKVEVTGKIVTTITKSKGFVQSLQVDADPKELQLKVEPPVPQSPRLEEIKETSVVVAWTEPEFHEFYNIRGYVVGFKKFGSGNKWMNVSITDKESRKYSLRNLDPETRYYVNVAAKNTFGVGVVTESQALQTKSPGFPEWLIAVIVVGGVALLVLLVLVLWYRRKCFTEMNENPETFYDVEMEHYTRANEYDDPNVKTLSLKRAFSNSVFEGDWREILWEDLKLSKELGSGAFGVVYKGHVVLGDDEVQCAVKTLKGNATKEDKRDLYMELDIMSTVGSHPNLVNLIGACKKGDALYIAIEFAENGCLLDFLKNNRSQQDCSSNLDTNIKLRLALDVAKGMEYLISRRCIHRDLAARNVLLTENYRGKIADFGMSRDIYSDGVYQKKTAGKLPVRWMALEAIETFMFSAETDVWSYGVLLWEIEAGGIVPWGGLDSKEIIQALKSGKRLQQPEKCMQEVYEVMLSCWETKPMRRPDFPYLVRKFENLQIS